MRDEFKTLGVPWNTEYGIYNTNDSKSTGEHWCCWIHKNKKWFHFCPYGADPPEEFINYNKDPVMSSTWQIQQFGTSICGELCVLVLYLVSEDIEFEDAVLALVGTENKFIVNANKN